MKNFDLDIAVNIKTNTISIDNNFNRLDSFYHNMVIYRGQYPEALITIKVSLNDELIIDMTYDQYDDTIQIIGELFVLIANNLLHKAFRNYLYTIITSNLVISKSNQFEITFIVYQGNEEIIKVDTEDIKFINFDNPISMYIYMLFKYLMGVTITVQPPIARVGKKKYEFFNNSKPTAPDANRPQFNFVSRQEAEQEHTEG